MDCLYLARLLAVHALIWVFENCQSVTVTIYVIKAPVTGFARGRICRDVVHCLAPWPTFDLIVSRDLQISMHNTKQLTVSDIKALADHTRIIWIKKGLP